MDHVRTFFVWSLIGISFVALLVVFREDEKEFESSELIGLACQCDCPMVEDYRYIDMFCPDSDFIENDMSEMIDYEQCLFERREIKLWNQFWKSKYRECKDGE